MRFILLISVFILTACEPYDPAPDVNDWRDATLTRKCTKSQLSFVKEQAAWCKDFTDYNGQYCMGTAMMTYCDKVTP